MKQKKLLMISGAMFLLLAAFVVSALNNSSLAEGQNRNFEDFLSGTGPIYIVMGQNSTNNDSNAASIIGTELMKQAENNRNITIVKEDQIDMDISDNNVILVGGSCINRQSAQILQLNFPTCGERFSNATGIESGEYLIQSFVRGDNGNAILIVGYDDQDTMAAARAITTQNTDLSPGKRYVGNTEDVMGEGYGNNQNNTGQGAGSGVGSNGSGGVGTGAGNNGGTGNTGY